MKRRRFLEIASAGAGLLAAGLIPAGTSQTQLHKSIPSSGEQIPVIGMGSSVTFNVGDDTVARDLRIEVLRTFFRLGGGVIDSSPMYGSSESVIGHGLQRLGASPGLFSATKVWTSSGKDGPGEIENSRRLWGISRFDLLQVHNLLSWEKHLETLFSMKEQGRVRYVGITTSHGRRHPELARIMQAWPVDFVQATYNILDREVEEFILPLATERQIAFIANRPYRRGNLIDHVKQHPLPGWAKEFDCANWGGGLLTKLVSHPSVTCTIPATHRVDHMMENMGALLGRLPDPATRKRMIAYVESL